MRSHLAEEKWHCHFAITGPLGARDWNAYLDRKLGLVPERVLDFKLGGVAIPPWDRGQRPAALWAVGRQACGEMLLRKLLRAYGEDSGARNMESGGESCFRRWVSGEHTVIL